MSQNSLDYTEATSGAQEGVQAKEEATSGAQEGGQESRDDDDHEVLPVTTAVRECARTKTTCNM